MERENALERCVSRLLDCPDLNLEELEDETLSAIQEARIWAEAESDRATYDELCNTVVYLAEQMEMTRIAFEQLVGEVVEIRKRLVKAEQERLF